MVMMQAANDCGELQNKTKRNISGIHAVASMSNPSSRRLLPEYLAFSIVHKHE